MHIRALRPTPLAYGLLTKRPIPADVLEGWVRPALSSRGVRGRRRSYFTRHIDKRLTLDAAAKLSGFDRPVLLAWSAEDRFFKQSFAERLAAVFPDARLESIPDAWTFLPEDQPGVLAGLIAEFAGSHSGGEDARRHRAGDRRQVARQPRARALLRSAAAGRRSPARGPATRRSAGRPRWAGRRRARRRRSSASMRSRCPGSARRSSRVEVSDSLFRRAAAFVTSGSDGRAIQVGTRQVRVRAERLRGARHALEHRPAQPAHERLQDLVAPLLGALDLACGARHRPDTARALRPGRRAGA